MSGEPRIAPDPLADPPADAVTPGSASRDATGVGNANAAEPAARGGGRCLVTVPVSVALVNVLEILEHGDAPVRQAFEARRLVSVDNVDAATRARLEALGAEIVEDREFGIERDEAGGAEGPGTGGARAVSPRAVSPESPRVESPRESGVFRRDA